MKEKILKFIAAWEAVCYFEGIPDQVPPRLSALNKAPSYKAIVRAIIQNDHQLKTLGLEPKKPNSYHELKRVELSKRGSDKQLKLF